MSEEFTLDDAHEAWPSIDSVAELKRRLAAGPFHIYLKAARERIVTRKMEDARRQKFDEDMRAWSRSGKDTPNPGYAGSFFDPAGKIDPAASFEELLRGAKLNDDFREELFRHAGERYTKAQSEARQREWSDRNFGGFQHHKTSGRTLTSEQRKALETARKCQAMETNDNPHQAEVARNRTDALLAKAGLTRADL